MALLVAGAFVLLCVSPAHAAVRARKATQAKAKIAQPAGTNSTAAKSTIIPAAEPASISLKSGELTVGAHNSDLAQILRNIAQLSGMQIEGLGHSSRVYGVYGPGKPQAVLTELLSGSGYNFMMVGESRDGAPRRLLLTAETEASAEPPAAQPSTSQPASPQPYAQGEVLPGRMRYGPSAPSAPGQRSYPPGYSPAGGSSPNQTPAPPPDLGPGAVYPQPPASDADREDRIQQMMNRLRAIHQQAQQQLNQDNQ